MSSSERRELNTLKFLDEAEVNDYYRAKGRPVPPWAKNRQANNDLFGNYAGALVLARALDLVAETGVHPDTLAEVSNDLREYAQAVEAFRELPANTPKPRDQVESLYKSAVAKLEPVQTEVWEAWEQMKAQAAND